MYVLLQVCIILGTCFYSLIVLYFRLMIADFQVAARIQMNAQ